MTTATPVLDFDNLVLTSDQQAAEDAFYAFLANPVETVFVLRGNSGCGKSTLVRKLLDRLPAFMKTVRLINPSATDLDVELTATTNKAAENLAQITGYPVRTIHAALGLRVSTDYKTNVTSLIPRTMDPLENKLLWVDEASTINGELLGLIFQRTKNCKIVMIGDPAQLTDVKSTSTPVFDAPFPGAALTQVVRQAEGNPIVDLSMKFRDTVNTGEFFSFKPDGHHVQHMDRAAFNAAIEAEFTRPDWRYTDSKILAWTNKCVVGFNQYVRNLAKGDPHFQVGDYAVCNSFLQVGKHSVKTDQLVQITAIDPDSVHRDVSGNWMTLDHVIRVFQPKNLAEAHARATRARREDDIHIVAEIEGSWSDLRGAAAQTINKSQGSTYGSVFVDLDDVSRCHNGNQIARMLYVGVSRARNHVYLTGDLA